MDLVSQETNRLAGLVLPCKVNKSLLSVPVPRSPSGKVYQYSPNGSVALQPLEPQTLHIRPRLYVRDGGCQHLVRTNRDRNNIGPAP